MRGAEKKRAGVLPGLVCAFSLCFLLFIYAPYELYLTNQLEFWFTAGQLLRPALLLFCGVFALLILLLQTSISADLFRWLVKLVTHVGCHER